MIVIASGSADALDLSTLTAVERDVYAKKQASPVVYRYATADALRFELKLRDEIVQASYELNRSGAEFAVFKDSECNPAYWERTEFGGFRLKRGVTPKQGIDDIFRNGHLYAFECATAMVIVLYKAVSESIDRDAFNRLFANTLLYTWEYDQDLRLVQEYGPERAVPGDILYFNNPDVDPETSWWRGENAVMLGDDVYYGHGIGIASAHEIIAELNDNRIPGSTRSAYMTDSFHHPEFAYLHQFAAPMRGAVWAKVGHRAYVLQAPQTNANPDGRGPGSAI